MIAIMAGQAVDPDDTKETAPARDKFSMRQTEGIEDRVKT
jgi:hypothetical protein